MSRKVNATYSAEQVKGAFRVFEGNSPGGCVRSDALIRFRKKQNDPKFVSDLPVELCVPMVLIG
jgi:hypothetical protein